MTLHKTIPIIDRQAEFEEVQKLISQAVKLAEQAGISLMTYAVVQLWESGEPDHRVAETSLSYSINPELYTPELHKMMCLAERNIQ